MRISDWSSDVCSSDLGGVADELRLGRVEFISELNPRLDAGGKRSHRRPAKRALAEELGIFTGQEAKVFEQWLRHFGVPAEVARSAEEHRSEEHTSELQSLMRISYAVFCLKKKKHKKIKKT